MAAAWERLLSGSEIVVTTNYVLIETTALVQRRLGMEALRAFVHAMVPVLKTVWIQPDVHDAALAAVMAADRRDLSLVDCTSFEVMRREGVRRVFALDDDFRRQGFETLPA